MKNIDKNYIEKGRIELRRKKIARNKMIRIAKVTIAGVIVGAVAVNIGSNMVEHYKWAKENPRANKWLIETKIEYATKKDRELAEKAIAEKVEAEKKREEILNKYSEIVSEQ